MKKKKNMIGLLLLFVLLAAVIVVYLMVKNRPADDENEEKDRLLFETDNPDFSRISYDYDGNSYSFIKKDESWVMEGEEAFPLNTTAVQTMENELKLAPATTVINDVKDLSEYGLDAPKLTVRADLSESGSQEKAYTLYVGNSVNMGSGRYVYFGSDSSTVYLTEENIYLKFNYDREKLFEAKKLPAFTVNDITSVLFMVDGYENYDLTYISEASTEDGSDSDIQGDMDENVQEADEWKLLKKSTGEISSCDESEVNRILAAAASISLNHMVDYREEHLADYGIRTDGTNQLLIWYKSEDGESNEVGLLFGNRTEDGDYYVNVDGTPNVFIITADKLEEFLTEDVQTT